MRTWTPLRMIVAGGMMAIVLPLCGLGVVGDETEKPAEKDYSAELPRIAALEPAEALKAFQTRPGFRVEIVASEPLIRDPVAIEFDEDGRLFVVEMPAYNQYANPAFMGYGCVKLLEDIDNDGRYETSTVYADRLETPTAIACYDGGIFVGSPPDLLYFKDTDGDGRADIRRRVLTGFGRDHAGEAMLNSFRWGLDNRFRISTSLAGGDVRPADDADQKPISVRGQGLLLDPRTLEFELTSGGGQHGMSMDDWGQTYVCSNSDPVQTLMYDGRYLARNPYMQAPSAAVSIARDGKYTDLHRISPLEPWRVLRTRLRSQGLVKGSDEGGKPAGFFTGATGVTIYRGSAWPEDHRGNVIVGDVANNIVYRGIISVDGLQRVVDRADADAEFLASSDIWFRPVQFAHGPDGALCVVDMYRELIEGAAFLPPEILKHLDVASGIDRGRIYRIVPETHTYSPPARLSEAGTSELVALLEHDNGWHRDTAARLLYTRQDQSAVGPLRKLGGDSPKPISRATALHALAGLNALTADDVSLALDDPDPNVRIQALQLAEGFVNSNPEVRLKVVARAQDEDIQVRYQAAFSLGAISGAVRAQTLATLLLTDGSHSWMRLAVQTSLDDGAGDAFRLLANNVEFRQSKHGATFLATLAQQIGNAGKSNEVADVLKTLQQFPAKETPLKQDLARKLIAGQQQSGRPLLAESSVGDAGNILKTLLADARASAGNRELANEKRVEAISTLSLAPFDDVAEMFRDLLDLQQPQPIQAAALDALSRFDQDAVSSLILEAWPGLSPQLRTRAAETLLSRKTWVLTLLTAIQERKVGRGEIDPARLRLLQAHPDAEIRERAAQLVGDHDPQGRAKVVTAYQSALTQKGDAMRGKLTFKKVCSSCHRLENVGEALGADLSAIRNRGTEAVLLNILDPNREVKPQYLSYVVVTEDGRTETGMIAGETATSITLRRTDGTNVPILRVHIEEMRSTGLSFMPEGLEKQLDVSTMADLLTYLESIR